MSLEYKMPYIIKEGSRGVDFIDINSHAYNRHNTIYLFGNITEEMVNATVMQFVNLQAKGEPIKIVINSSGGSVLDGMVLVDLIEGSSVPVDIYVAGKAMSMAAVILSAAGCGHRHALKSSQILIHEPRIMGGGGGTATDLASVTESLIKVRDITSKVLAKYTGHTLEEINNLIKGEDVVLTAKEAIEFGIVDDIVEQL